MEIKVRPSARIGDYERGIKAERERIIKLLEDNCECDFDNRCCPCGHVALIKGENK